MNGLLANPVDLDLSTVFAESWAWLLQGPFAVHAITQFGDCFLKDQSGKVWFLDTMEATVSAVADSPEQLAELSCSPEWRDNYLLEALAESLATTLGPLPPGKVFAFAPPPVLAGHIVKEGAMFLPLRAYESLMGQLHQQLRGKPPGFAVSGINLVP